MAIKKRVGFKQYNVKCGLFDFKGRRKLGCGKKSTSSKNQFQGFWHIDSNKAQHPFFLCPACAKKV